MEEVTAFNKICDDEIAKLKEQYMDPREVPVMNIRYGSLEKAIAIWETEKKSRLKAERCIAQCQVILGAIEEHQETWKLEEFFNEQVEAVSNVTKDNSSARLAAHQFTIETQVKSLQEMDNSLNFLADLQRGSLLAASGAA